MVAYENYPSGTILLSNALAVLIYATGITIVSRLGFWPVVPYVLYCIWVEYRVLKRSCVNCYYYGKSCGLGKGRICSLLFKQGDPEDFVNDEIAWLDVLPDFLVSSIPLALGIVLLVLDFTWALCLLLILLIVLSSAGNAVVRGSFLCKYCKQKELGCPAQELFGS